MQYELMTEEEKAEELLRSLHRTERRHYQIALRVDAQEPNEDGSLTEHEHALALLEDDITRMRTEKNKIPKKVMDKVKERGMVEPSLLSE